MACPPLGRDGRFLDARRLFEKEGAHAVRPYTCLYLESGSKSILRRRTMHAVTQSGANETDIFTLIS